MDKPKLPTPPEPNEIDAASALATTLLGAFTGPLSNGLIILKDLAIPNTLEKRRDNWFKLIGEAIIELQEQYNEIDLIENLKNNEEFISILIETCRSATKTHKSEKLKYYKEFLKNSFKFEDDFYDKQLYLEYLNTINPSQILILRWLIKFQKEHKGVNSYQKFHNLFTQGSSGMFKPFIDESFSVQKMLDLEKKGLIRVSEAIEDLTNEVREKSGSILLENQENNIDLPYIYVNEFGINLIKYIEN
jgi:hypothetical protein